MSRLRFTLFAFYVFCCCVLPAQTTDPNREPYLLAFRLDDKEAVEIARNTDSPLDESWLHHLADTLFKEEAKYKLPPGAYLLVQASQESLRAEFFLSNSLQVNLLNTDRGFAFALLDSLGREVSNARVLLGGRPVPFEPNQKCYTLPGQKRGGMLEIYANGELLLAKIEPGESKQMKPFWFHYYRVMNEKKGFKRAIHQPVAFLTALWKQSESQKNQKARMRKYRRAEVRAFKGYITVSQPLYRPGDTLRVKAYLTTGTKGKPYNKPLTMVLTQYIGNKNIQREVKPAYPGSFEFTWPLNDSLVLDRECWVSFYDQYGKENNRGMSVRFRYEDYELDEVNFDLKAEQETFRRGEPVRLRVHALDANGQPMVEGQLSLNLLSAGASKYFASELYIPDTLWRITLPLSPSGETLLEVPDSIWPEASLRITANAQFTNSAGELQEKKCAFNVERAPAPVEAFVKNDSVFVFFKKQGSPPRANQATIYLLRESWHDREESTDHPISIPYSAPLSPGLQDLELLANEETLLANLLERSSRTQEPSCFAGWAADTAQFELGNPARVALRWWVARNKEIIAQGVTSDLHWHWQVIDSEQPDFTLHYAYTWAGMEQGRNCSLEAPSKNLLSIRLEQPEQVQPGASVPVKITVLDAQERPVQNAQLSAGAYNAQFDNQGTAAYDRRLPYVAPAIRQRLAKAPRRYTAFEINEIYRKAFFLPLSVSWQKRLGVYDLLFYRLRNVPNETPIKTGSVRGFCETFPVDSGAYAKPEYGQLPNLPAPEDSFALLHPQFSPFIVEKGKAVPVYLIWCNGQLVWYAGASDERPYSFYGNPGYNSFKLRSGEGEFSIDSIWLEKGERLVFSIEKEDVAVQKLPLQFVGHSKADKISRARIRYLPWGPRITPYERNVLQQSMLLWKPGGNSTRYQYFWQNAENIHVVRDYQRHYSAEIKPQIIGPFPPRSVITTLRQGKFINRFLFEPGFEYNIDENRERLYQSNWPPDTLTFTQQIALQDPGYPALLPQDIEPLSSERPRINYSNTGTAQSGKGKLHLGLLPKEVPLLAYVLAGDTLLGPFNPANNSVSGIRPGAYRLLFLSTEGKLAERPVLIRPNAEFHLDFQDTVFREPKPDELVDSLFRLDWTDQELRTLFHQPIPFSLDKRFGSAWTLKGIVTDKSGETLIGATVKVYQNDVFIQGTVTDIDGYYAFSLSPGTYAVEVSYTGFMTHRMTGVPVLSGRNTNKLNFVMEDGGVLQEVVVTALGITRERRVLGYATIGYGSIDGGDVNIRGSRMASTNYYLDGIRITTGKIPPVQDLDQLQVTTGGIISVNDEEPFAEATEARSQFSDYAYWQPNLRTDAKGEAYFQATFPDNITAWRSYVLGMDRRARAGMTVQTTQAFKALQAQLSLPRFVVAGDRFDAVGRVRNLLADSTEIRTQFVFEGKTLKENTRRIGSSLVEMQSLEAPQNADSLTLAYNMQGHQSADGEQRSIAILPVGTLEKNGQFLLLEGDTSCSLQFDPSRGPVSVSLRSSALPLLLEDLDYLKNYPYGCNEQTASRLLALLTEREIKTALKQALPHEKNLRECLKRLEQSQLTDGSWGWWADGRPNAWMTAYVAKALWKANKSGFSSVSAMEKGLNWLRQNLAGFTPTEQYAALFTLRECGVNLDCKPFLTSANTRLPSIATLRLLQLCGEKIHRDSLMRWLRPTATGGLRALGSAYGWYDCHAQNTLMAYDIAVEAGWNDITTGIRRYWLESRSAISRRNTLETAQILLRLLPSVLDAEGKLAESRLEINGIVVENLNGQQVFAASQQALQVRKTGSAPLYLAAWQEWQNPHPQTVDSLFKIETRLEQGGKTVQSLQKGEPAELVVTVEVRKSAEYAMLDIPIPAACSYGLKTQPFGAESHREYFRERTAIFCEGLSVGQHTFRIALEPRFTGSFTLNAARMELMYFPVLFGRNEGRQVKIMD